MGIAAGRRYWRQYSGLKINIFCFIAHINHGQSISFRRSGHFQRELTVLIRECTRHHAVLKRGIHWDVRHGVIRLVNHLPRDIAQVLLGEGGETEYQKDNSEEEVAFGHIFPLKHQAQKYKIYEHPKSRTRHHPINPVPLFFLHFPKPSFQCRQFFFHTGNLFLLPSPFYRMLEFQHREIQFTI